MFHLQLLCVYLVLLAEGRAAGGWASFRHLDDYDYDPDVDLGPESREAVGQYRRISWTPEGIPVRTIFPPGYEPPPQPLPAPLTTAAPATPLQLVNLEQGLPKQKKQKKRRPWSWDPLDQSEEDYDEYRDQHDEEDESDLDFEDEETGFSSEETDDEGDFDYGGQLSNSGNSKKKNKNKNKRKNKRKNKKSQGMSGPRRPPPWEKYAPLPRPQRLQEVAVWGYQNEYNRGWGKSKKLAEAQKAAWLAARKREAEYREWFENLPEERQEWILRTQAEERRRKGYKAYAHALREIGGLPLAPSGPTSDYYPPPGWPAGGAVGTGVGGGGWATRFYRTMLLVE